MQKKIQTITQLIFLTIFIILIIHNLLPIWMGIFGVFLLLSMMFSRFYCGYICPINTVMKPISFLKRIFKVPNVNSPKFLKHPSTRYISLFLVVGLLAFSMITGDALPILPLLVLIGAMVTLIYDESLFHRHLCPYGTLLKVASKPTKKAVSINEDACINCGKCKKVCPTEAITKHTSFHRINKQECLTCFACARACPINVIAYRSVNT